MFQNSKTKYEVPIDWDYSKRWVVCLDFLVNQDLYGVLNDGGIFKFKYRETQAIRLGLKEHKL